MWHRSKLFLTGHGAHGLFLEEDINYLLASLLRSETILNKQNLILFDGTFLTN